MNKQTILSTILLWLLVILSAFYVQAQSEINRQERIIEIDKQIQELNEWIEWHKKGFNISMEASEECKESFIQEAWKEHDEADKKRELIKQLEEEKVGLMKNR